MLKLLEGFLSFFKNFFKEKSTDILDVPREIQGVHDCGLRALYIVLPNISIEDMLEAFSNCCNWWPYKGISNKEFNITLDYLKLKNKFDYIAPEISVTLNDLMKHKKSTFIALIYGHYTVIKNGIYWEKGYQYSSKNTKVFCYWRLNKK